MCQLTGADNAPGTDYCPASAEEETDSSCSPHPAIPLWQAAGFLHHEGLTCLILEGLESNRFKAATLSKSEFSSFSFVDWLNAHAGLLHLVVVKIRCSDVVIVG